MSMIPDEMIEQVRDSADLVSVIGESVELKRTGADYRGPCPFHGGTHRNFAVIPKKQLYYCYVCHAAGDVFSYFMKRFGMDYPTAVREVARRSGIVIPETTRQAGPDPREPLYSAVALAQDWFARQLLEAPEGDNARRYLQGRGLDMETVQPLGLGYAPTGTVFLDAMGKHQIPNAVMLEAGLLHQRDDGRITPRFRGRLLFPIHDLRGRVVGFSGRILGPGEPKYLNSPESPIFHKGTMLYNMHEAKNAIRKEEQAILVEGQFDVLRLVLAGVENVVAPLGTALTPDQATLLRRFAPSAVLMYDSDAAGQRATFRAGDELLRREMRVRVATMPAGEDPDTLAKNGGLAAVEKVVHDAIDIMERKIQLLEQKGWFGDVEHRREALDRLLPTVRASKDPITRDLYLSLVAERTGVSKRVLEQELSVPQPHHAFVSPVEEKKFVEVVQKSREALKRVGRRSEIDILKVILQYDGWVDRARSDIPPEWMEGVDTRELYLAIMEGGSGTLSPETIEKMAEQGRALFSTVITPDASLNVHSAGDVYEGARSDLEARPRYREYSEFNAYAKASGDVNLVTEAIERKRALQAQFEKFDAKYNLGVKTMMRSQKTGRTRSRDQRRSASTSSE